MSDDDFLAENEKDGQGSDDCFLENWAALRTRLEGGRLELLAEGCVLPPHLWPAAPPYAPPRPKRFILQLAAILVQLTLTSAWKKSWKYFHILSFTS